VRRCGIASRYAALRSTRREHGSAVAEFVLVAILVVVLAMGVFQLALGLYVRNALIAAAAEGARLGARADATLADGVARTRELIASTLQPAYGENVVATHSSVDGVAVVEVSVTAPLPVIGLLGPGGALTVTARAYQEGQ